MKDKPVIKLKETYLSGELAAKMLSKPISAIKGMVEKAELRGRISDDGRVSVFADDVYLTPKIMAIMLYVQEKDILEWITTDELKAIKANGQYKIPYKEYSSFGQSGKWMKKFHDNSFELFKKMATDGEIINEVNEGFRRGMKPRIVKARQVIEDLEKIHNDYQSQINVLDYRTALVASYVICARIISLLYSTLNLIEKDKLVGASVLFRSIYEGMDLAQYFILSTGSKNAQKKLARWFEGGDVKNTTTSDFLLNYIDENGLADRRKTKKQKDQMYDIFSGFVHFKFESIMESFNALGSSGFGQRKVHQIGFDYKGTKLLRKSVGFLTAFEGLLTAVLATFIICFRESLPLKTEHEKILLEHRDYFSKDVMERNKILKDK
ncbi:MAG: hypothetical protein KC733_05000 [Candidatus Omnitrophica bacterium]|nr:hypothetical protein [Candidatus Omnitrophota bacterium]